MARNHWSPTIVGRSSGALILGPVFALSLPELLHYGSDKNRLFVFFLQCVFWSEAENIVDGKWPLQAKMLASLSFQHGQLAVTSIQLGWKL